MLNYLPKFEIIIYFTIYGIFLLYGIANIFLLSNRLTINANYGFADGWKIIGRKRDDSDDEWESFKMFLWKNFKWYMGHISLAESCRFLEPTFVPVAHSLIGLAFILATYQIQTIFTILCQLLTFYYISRFNRKSIVWFLAIVWIAVINILKNNSNLYEHDTYEEYYELIIALSWCILKCLSFNLSKIECADRNNSEFMKSFNFVNYCGYILYFPTFIFGPFMVFDRYTSFIGKPTTTVDEFRKRATELLRNFIRVVGWLLFTDFALHFLYVNYLEQNLLIIKSLNSWALYGFGYLMGQFFYSHYMVSYGMGISLAKFDNINAPNQPKCIGRIHFYSDMWKYFDQGLYEFLFRYIYCSLCSKSSSQYKKLLASISTFVFIYIWHGFFVYVLVWTALNFLCLSLEKLFKYFTNTTFYMKLIAKNFSVMNQKRIYAILGTQIFIPSAISNFYFFAGVDVGNYFMSRTYQSGLISYLGVTACCYCIFQCAEFIEAWERYRKSIK